MAFGLFVLSRVHNFFCLWLIQGCATWQGMAFGLFVLNRVYNFVCPEQGVYFVIYMYDPSVECIFQSLYGWWGLYDIYNHLQQRNFRVLKYRKYASIPWKKWLWFVIRLSHGISRHCSEQKIHVLRAIKIISIILSLRIVIRSAMKAGFTMKFYFTGRDYKKATNDNFTSFIQINV